MTEEKLIKIKINPKATADRVKGNAVSKKD
jgi:hypothetical protein